MSVDIHVFVLKKDDTGTWKEVELFKRQKGNFVPIKIYSDRSHELFNVLTKKQSPRQFLSFPSTAFSVANTDLSFVYKYKEAAKKNDSSDFYEANFADIKNFINETSCTPIIEFFDTLINYLYFADRYDTTPLSAKKVVYWFGV